MLLHNLCRLAALFLLLEEAAAQENPTQMVFMCGIHQDTEYRNDMMNPLWLYGSNQTGFPYIGMNSYNSFTGEQAFYPHEKKTRFGVVVPGPCKAMIKDIPTKRYLQSKQIMGTWKNVCTRDLYQPVFAYYPCGPGTANGDCPLQAVGAFGFCNRMEARDTENFLTYCTATLNLAYPYNTKDAGTTLIYDYRAEGNHLTLTDAYYDKNTKSVYCAFQPAIAVTDAKIITALGNALKNAKKDVQEVSQTMTVSSAPTLAQAFNSPVPEMAGPPENNNLGWIFTEEIVLVYNKKGKNYNFF